MTYKVNHNTYHLHPKDALFGNTGTVHDLGAKRRRDPLHKSGFFENLDGLARGFRGKQQNRQALQIGLIDTGRGQQKVGTGFLDLLGGKMAALDALRREPERALRRAILQQV